MKELLNVEAAGRILSPSGAAVHRYYYQEQHY